MIVSTSHRVCTMKNIDFSDFFNVFLSGATIGEPIFSRFDAVIKFEKLNKDAIQKIMENEFERQYSTLDETEKGIVDRCQLRGKIFALVEQLDNARQIRRIIREAFSAILIQELL